MPAGKPIKRTDEEREALPPSKRGTHNHKPPVPLKRAKCGAVKQNKEKCGLPAGYGTAHPGKGPCKHHFGNTRGVEKGVALDDAQDVIEKIRGMGVEMDIDPIDALIWSVRDIAGRVAWHSAVIARWQILQPDGSARALTPEEADFYARYQEERDALVRAAKMAQSAGVSERAVALAEQTATILANTIEQILAALQLNEAQRALIPEVVPPIMRANAVRVPLIEGVVSTDEDINAAYAAYKRGS